MTDYKVAMKKAADEKKDMLLDFSGSDWCKWCIQLDKEVFSQKEFIEAASKDFVFVMLDYPQDKSKMTPKLLAQNEQLQKKFRVQGFPTVLLTDVAGKPYAQTGYQAGGPKAYLAHLAELRKSRVQAAEFMAKAESTEIDDVEKAKLLDKAINLMSPEMVANYYSDLIDKIIAYDSDNKAGLRDNYLAKKASQKAVEQLQAGNIDKGIEMIDKIISDYKISAQTTQEVYYLKALAIRGKGDDAAVLENLKKAVGAAPESQMGTYIEGIIKTHFSNPQPKPTPATVPESTPQPTVEKTTE
jgi:thioredoxin-related protein